ncbi:MAG: class I SAM-dependent methyltransferase [Chloroflexi bacterium]|nr:class I SAM-dependent methyltransferase [Chloroflexota bacterium]
MSKASEHYNKEYFDWQCSIGEFGGWANLTKFEKYIRPHFNILDFGCGGGYLLSNIVCKGKMGIEINEGARRQAVQLGLDIYTTTSQIQDDWADIIISNNALEHTLHPLLELEALYPKLKSGGYIVFVVPCESIHYKYIPNHISYHLYSWSPMCIGNLFTEAGFVVQESKPYFHKWPPKYRAIARLGGRKLFEISCKITGYVRQKWIQVRVVARKE